MNAVKAKVVNGRYVLDEPAELPEGTELYLVPVTEEDEDRIDVEEANKVLEAMKASARGAGRPHWPPSRSVSLTTSRASRC